MKIKLPFEWNNHKRSKPWYIVWAERKHHRLGNMEYCYAGTESLWYWSWNRHLCKVSLSPSCPLPPLPPLVSLLGAARPSRVSRVVRATISIFPSLHFFSIFLSSPSSRPSFSSSLPLISPPSYPVRPSIIGHQRTVLQEVKCDIIKTRLPLF